MVSRESFTQAVEELGAASKLSVSALADKLCVSRSWLYDNFPEVRNLGRARLSEDDVIVEIEKIRAEKPAERITVEALSSRLGITRQTFSRNFGHLYDLLNPDSDIYRKSSVEETLLAQVKDLQKKLNGIEKEHEAALKKKEDQIFSDLMRKDAEEFNTIKTSSSLKRLQNQAEDQAQLAREKTKENAALRLQIAKLKSNEAQGGCEVINHLKPDYSAVSNANNPSAKDILRMFTEAEKHNLKAAEDIAVEQKPDHIILFQPYFSCDRLAIPVLPLAGKVLIVESNIYRIDHRNEFIKNLRGYSIIALQASASLAKTKLWARGAKIPFDAEFISKLHAEIALAVIDDGLSAVINFDPERFVV
jgi:hypothetical protein